MDNTLTCLSVFIWYAIELCLPSLRTVKLASWFPWLLESITFRGSAIVNFPFDEDKTLIRMEVLSFSAETSVILAPVNLILDWVYLITQLQSKSTVVECNGCSSS